MGNTLTGQIVAETYEALLKVTDNGIITGTKKRITDGFGNDTPLLLSSTDVQIDGNFLLPGTTLQYVRGDGSLATFPTIISTLTTTGSSGASTLIGSTLNIPNYTLTGLGGVPTSRTLTINGTTFDLSANRSWTITDTGLTSVGVSMPSAFTVSNSPLTANGTIAITGAGLASQYIRGDGTLANFPTGSGGGSSVVYYLNGSINASVATYKQMSNSAIIGAGTDFALAGNGLIAQFLTDVNNPNRLIIPGGAWNSELYFSASSAGGTPEFYLELLKYNGTTFTSIASTSSNPAPITSGTITDLYTTSLAVPETILLATDRLVIRVYIVNNIPGRTITLHTEDNNLCEIITTFSTGIASLNSLTSSTQFLTVGTSGTDFAISSATSTHTFNLPTASATNRGALSSADWTTFNSKIGGTGTTNYVPKFSGSTSIANSLIYDTGTAIGIGTTSPNRLLTVAGTTSGFIALNASSYRNTTIGSDSVGSFIVYDDTASAYRMVINSAGNIGIGTTSPNSNGGSTAKVLHINSSGIGDWAVTHYTNGSTGNAAGDGFLVGNVGADSYIYNYESAALILATSSVERMRIDSSGNVGIGTTSPNAAKLVLNSGTTNQNALINGDKIGFTRTSDAAEVVYFKKDISLGAEGTANINGYDGIQFRTQGAETVKAVITSGGNVGIGTSSPSTKLNVVGHIRAEGTDSDLYYYEGTRVGTATTYRVYDNATNIYLDGYRSIVLRANQLGGSGGGIFLNGGNVLVGLGSDNSTTAKLQVGGGISYQNIFNTQTASYTLALTDQSKIVETNVGSANNVTIPLDSSVNFPIGTEIQVLQLGAGQTTIVATSGVTTRSKSNQLKIANQNTGVTLVKRAANDWYVIGNLTA